MSTLTVLFADQRTESELEWIRQLEPARALRLLAPGDGSNEALAALLSEAEAIVTQYRPMPAATIAAAPQLKLIQRYGSRPDGIDLQAAQQAGVAVATMPLRGSIAVAELAITLILALSKNLIRAHQATESGAYRELGIEPIKTEQWRHKF